MIHKRVAHELKHTQRDLLIAHVDGSNDIPVPVFVHERTSARQALIAKGLLRPDRPHHATKTIITENGRQVLAIVLADYAEALVRAGYAAIASPIEVHPRPIAIEAVPELEAVD